MWPLRARRRIIGRKGKSSFLKKRTKKLLFRLSPIGRRQPGKSIFASFSSEKEDSLL
jgi:hypothetical protein